MLINEFYMKFTSLQEKSRLFNALRRVSQMDERLLLSSGTTGWTDWPPLTVKEPGIEKI